jgi:fibronectin type 3 domain-containing protein
VELSWTAVPDSDLVHYAIYRALASFDPDTMPVFATTADTSYLDAAPGEAEFFYRVRAVDLNGNESDASNEAAVNLIPLPAPLYLTLTRMGSDVILRWLPVEEASQYRVYGADASDGPGTFVAATSEVFYVYPANEAQKFFWVRAER